jgi:molecular chaperone HtpG
MRDGKLGVQLYVKRVFIMNDWEALLPPWLRFVRGVVASDELSLNVSREILQKDRQIQAIRKHLTRRLLGALKDLPRDQYVKFWPEFGAVLKEGLIVFDENQDRILELVMARSTAGGLTSPADYVGRMKEGQDAIYYMTAASQSAAERSPHLEAFRDKRGVVLHGPRGRAVVAAGPSARGQKAGVGGCRRSDARRFVFGGTDGG